MDRITCFSVRGFGPLGLALLLACGEEPATLEPNLPPVLNALIVPPIRTYVDVSAGSSATCAVRSDGVVDCFGRNDNGEAPTTVTPAIGSFTQVSRGVASTCALRSDGRIVCWGSNLHGQAPPLRIAASGGYVQLDSDWTHTCAVRDDGIVECWGDNDEGHEGQAPPTRAPSSGQFVQVSAGGAHTCATRSDGIVECWGENRPGNTPAIWLPGSGRFTQVAALADDTCALRDDGMLECIGVEYDPDPSVIAPAAAGTRFIQVSGRGSSDGVCALRDDGAVECWLSGSANGVKTAATGTFVQVSQGGGYACARRSDGALQCWGTDSEGSAPTVRVAPQDHVFPVATFGAPASVVVTEPIPLALTNAQVPGYPSATAFTYAFDCGSGSYGVTGSSATASCPTSIAGSRTVRGKVVDQDGDKTEYSATVTVKSAPEATSDLRLSVTGVPLAPDIRKALLSKLDAALKAIAQGKINTACSSLGDFINQVKAQRGKAIPVATADEWILMATRLRAALGC